jgi:hypothetical protein
MPMRFVPLLLLVLCLLPYPAPACSLCGDRSRSISLTQEFDQASYVLYGQLKNPKFDNGPGAVPGAGTTEFHVDSIVKDDPAFPRQKMILLSRYLPVLDPKDPPRYVMFFQPVKLKAQPYTGRHVSSPVVLDFVTQLLGYRDNPTEMLLFAAKHFDHADPQVAEEAFLVFARAEDKLIGATAKKLNPAGLRKLIATPDLEAERLSLFAYLLGACGNADDLATLRTLLKDHRKAKAYEGILAGYITMRPDEGWTYTHELLKNDKTSFLLRYASLRTMRFYYNAKPEEYGKHVMHGLGLAIQRADVADIAISDLRNWKRWEHTGAILACFDKTSHHSAIVKNSIIRYALVCPQPEARTFLERVRREDPKLVRYLEEELK